MTSVGHILQNEDNESMSIDDDQSSQLSPAMLSPSPIKSGNTASKDHVKDKKIENIKNKVLRFAEQGRLIELVQAVFASPSAVDYQDDDGYTPLHRASYNGHLDCVKFLIKRGAKLDARTEEKWTPLHCAVKWNNVSSAECLINAGADVNAKSSGDNTPLHLACTNSRYSATCDNIQLLLYQPNCQWAVVNNSGDTAFDIAKRKGPFYRLWIGVTTIYPNNEIILKD